MFIIRLIYIALVFTRFFIFNKFQDNVELGRKLASLLESLGPSFIKLGQAISTRPDIFGYKFTEGISILQDRMKPFDINYVIEYFKKDLNTEIDILFSEFDKTAIAAASVAQVHKAILKDGTQVAVKILRPKIHNIMQRDVKLFRKTAKLLSRFKKLKMLKLSAIVEVLAETMKMELDLRMEAAAADEIRANLRNDHNIIIPKIHWHMVSKNIMVTDWAEGIAIHDVETIKSMDLCIHTIASNLATSFFNQAFRDGFFHADLHPGNIFVTTDNKIILVDFGIMGRLNERDRIFFAKILKGFLDRDYYTVSDEHYKAGILPKDKCIYRFAQACRAVGETIIGLPSNKVYVGKLISTLFEIAKDFEMELQPHFILLQKNIVLVEGVGSMIDPDVNLWKLSEPWIHKWYIDNLGIKAQILDIIKSIIRNYIRKLKKA